MKRKRCTQQAPSFPNNQHKSEGQENKKEEICSLKKKMMLPKKWKKWKMKDNPLLML
jgi:hypothetical protein